MTALPAGAASNGATVLPAPVPVGAGVLLPHATSTTVIVTAPQRHPPALLMAGTIGNSAHAVNVLLALNKPYLVHCKFTDDEVPPRPTLAQFGLPPRVYVAGRLDHDSEGLLLLTDDGKLNQRLTDPRWKAPKTYLVHVEGTATEEQLAKLRAGVDLKDGRTLPAEAKAIEQPAWLWPRTPPVRFRKTVPDCWIELTIREGRNRQVRRMTAAVGLPTLRLVRSVIGPYALDGLAPGQWREVDATRTSSSR